MCDDSLTKLLWRKLVNEREAVGRRGRENGGGKAKTVGWPCERPHSRAQIAAMTTRKGPDGLLEEALWEARLGPLSVLQAWGGWSRKIKSLNDRRLVASLKFACVQPDGSWRKISQARGVKTKKRFYIWSTSGWGSGERGRKRDAWRRKNLLPTRHAFAEKQYLCIS